MDSFVETDDVVRRNLDRKEKVHHIRYRVDASVPDPMMMAPRSRSPLRGSSPLREVMDHEIRSRSPYAHYVHHPPSLLAHHPVGGPGPIRREYSPTRKENMPMYSHLGMSSYVPGGTGRVGSPPKQVNPADGFKK